MIINDNIISLISKSTIVEFESISKKFYKSKKDEHKRIGNSHSIINSINFFLYVTENNDFSNVSYYIALIHKFKSQLLLEHASSKSDIENSLININRTIDIMSSINLNEEGVDSLISSHLIRAVLFKIMDDKDEALYSIKNSKKELKAIENSGKSLIKLNRQEQIMHQTTLSHKYLLTEAIEIRKSSAIEFYSSYKRLFEFYLNNKMYDKGIKAYSVFIKSFTDVNSELPHISKISFMKNIGQYNIAIGNEKEATRILTIALKKAMDLGLNGQIMQIQNLINSIASTKDNLLITYKVKKK
ncbi:hypothetical protein [Xanthomarina gelatinilytica]|uniref:hypothetical protein n=1 Tax=Xanthomarina gelatinilytica TaxID=1137281 RepID=UPI003AA84095